MYYSKGNYEAFARPIKPQGVDNKRAHIIGGGLAGLAAAFFLIRDGRMAGKNITIYEETKILGGACDGICDPRQQFIFRGGREMEDHFECLWDLFRSVPSLEHKDASVLDEFYWLNKYDPNYSLLRATIQRGKDAKDDGKFGLSRKGIRQLMKLFMTKESVLEDKKINDVFNKEIFNSNFWMYWRTMFAFEEWHSALEMRRYFLRFVHHIDGIADFSALKFSRYNQYESLIQPLVAYLDKYGIKYVYDAKITNVKFNITTKEKIAKSIEATIGGSKKTISLTTNDLVFITNGSCTENSTLGDHEHPALIDQGPAACWGMWRNIAKQSSEFGHPNKFCTNIPATKWESVSIQIKDHKIIKLMEKIAKRPALSGKVVTGGIVTVKDSHWLMSYNCNRQPQFKVQPKNHAVIWMYGLFPENKGDYIKKPMQDCTGREMCEEWLYHIGAPVKDIHELSDEKSMHAVPCMMPYITSFFMPRKKEDRPLVVPHNSKNFAFIGQFAETERDCIFTTEYSVRTAMEATYQLLNIDRGVPEVYGSCYDVRYLMNSASVVSDGKTVNDLFFFPRFAIKAFLRHHKQTFIADLLKKYKLN